MVDIEHQVLAARAALVLCLGKCKSDCLIIELSIDGTRFFVAFDPDHEEHDRRTAAGVGAATSTGLLHALWELPEGMPVHAAVLPERDLSTLQTHGAGFVDGSSVLLRTYVPAGRIIAVLGVSDSLASGLATASRLPPIYWRLAVGIQRSCTASEAMQAAERRGIGGVVMHGHAAELVLSPRSPVPGVPAVYRWWLCELAYRNWVYGNCAHCSS